MGRAERGLFAVSTAVFVLAGIVAVVSPNNWVLAVMAAALSGLTSSIVLSELLSRQKYSPAVLLFSSAGCAVSALSLPGLALYWDEMSQYPPFLAFAPHQFELSALMQAYLYMFATVMCVYLLPRVNGITSVQGGLVSQVRDIAHVKGLALRIAELSIVGYLLWLVLSGRLALNELILDSNDSVDRVMSVFVLPALYAGAMMAGIRLNYLFLRRGSPISILNVTFAALLLSVVLYCAINQTRRTLLACLGLFALPYLAQRPANSLRRLLIGAAGSLVLIFVVISPIFENIRATADVLRSEGGAADIFSILTSTQLVVRGADQIAGTTAIIDAQRKFAVGYLAEIVYSVDADQAEWGAGLARSAEAVIPHQLLPSKADVSISPGSVIQNKFGYALTDTGWTHFNTGAAEFSTLGIVLGPLFYVAMLIPIAAASALYKSRLAKLIVFSTGLPSMVMYEAYPTLFTANMRLFLFVLFIDALCCRIMGTQYVIMRMRSI